MNENSLVCCLSGICSRLEYNFFFFFVGKQSGFFIMICRSTCFFVSAALSIDTHGEILEDPLLCEDLRGSFANGTYGRTA